MAKQTSNLAVVDPLKKHAMVRILHPKSVSDKLKTQAKPARYLLLCRQPQLWSAAPISCYNILAITYSLARRLGPTYQTEAAPWFV